MTLPGDITSPTAGPLLRRGAIVTVLRRTPADEEAEDCDGTRVSVGQSVTVTDCGSDGDWVVVHGITVDPLGASWSQLHAADVTLDLPGPDGAGMDLAARWLSRHLGNWQPWEITRAVQGHHPTLTTIYRQLGLKEPGRWEPHPDPAAALRLAVMTAAGRDPATNEGDNR